jgi:pentatricopeptide repeat protein
MAPPVAASLRRHLPFAHLCFLSFPSHHLRLSTSHSLPDQSDFELDHPLPPAPDEDGELSSFVHRVSSVASAASSPKHALSLLRASASDPSLTSPSLLVRALWELRGDPDAAALALRYADRCGSLDGVKGEGPPPPVEAWHLVIRATGKARRFDLAWAVVRRMRRRGVLTRRAMVILMERCVLLHGICHRFVALYFKIFKIHRDVKGFAFILSSVWRWLLEQCTAIVKTMLPF